MKLSSDENQLPPEPPVKRRSWIELIIFALSAIAYMPFSEWMATGPVGTSYSLFGNVIYGMSLIVAILAVPVLIIRLIPKRTRHRSLSLLIMSVLFIIPCVVGFKLGSKVRRAGLQSFIQRSQSLISAINAYERDHSVPPYSLHDLVPNYVSAVPSTGMMASPDYHYYSGEKASDLCAGNPWALSVSTLNAGSFDKMLYFPDQNYPKRGYGGRLESIEDWAYVHE